MTEGKKSDAYGVRPGEVAVSLPQQSDAGLYFIGRTSGAAAARRNMWSALASVVLLALSAQLPAFSYDDKAASSLVPKVTAFSEFEAGTCSETADASVMGFGSFDSPRPDRLPVFWVTDPRDYDRRQSREGLVGTLRWAVESARRQRGGRILFDPVRMRGAKITLLETIALPSNVIVDGGCSAVTLSAKDTVTIFAIQNVETVMVKQLRFEKTTYDPTSKTARDAITLSKRFRELSPNLGDGRDQAAAV